jgi:P-type Ca2+ transporter type 2C
MIGAQILIIFVGGAAFNISYDDTPQTGAQWAYAIVLGVISIPVGMVIRLIPDSLVSRLVPEILKRRSSGNPGLTVSDEEKFNYYPDALADVRDELAFLKRIKGGRLNNLRFAMTHPVETFMPKSKSPSHSRSNSMKIPQTPVREDSTGSHALTPESRRRSRSRSMRSRSNSALGAPTVMAGIIAGSIAAGWSPIERPSGERDFGQLPRNSPSPLSNRDGSGLQSAPIFSEEPENMEQDNRDGPSSSSGVPRLSVPTPHHHEKPRKSVS